MARSETEYVCQNCEAQFSKWQGQCDQCGVWNTLVEELKQESSRDLIESSRVMASKNLKTPKMSRLGKASSAGIEDLIQTLGSVQPQSQLQQRQTTYFSELDRVLGGGLVPGEVILMGGEPGIGKSTLLTQVVIEILLNEHKTETILYVSGEESPSQISLRINRYTKKEHIFTKQGSSKVRFKVLGDKLLFLASTDVDTIAQVIVNRKPKLVIVDSIQTLTTKDLTGSAGSIGQLRESTDRLSQLVKALHIPIFLIGHVTKDGVIAGPKVLEHIVDCVLEISGERTSQLRLIRAIKNRFGATDEVGVFQHSEYGLDEVTNPSALFLEQGKIGVPGSATVCVMEGTRPLLAEIQSLVVSSQLAMPRRVGRGIELSRIQVLAAVLQKHCGLPLGSHDIFLNAAGGFTIREPAVDLGSAVAIASSLVNKKLSEKSVFIGEVGLLGEIRKVSFLDKRTKEAKRLGYSNVYSRETHSTLKELLKDLGLK
jgi:DNA repair protein RadA/Sms